MNVLNCSNEYLVEALLIMDDAFVGKVIKATVELSNKKDISNYEKEVEKTANIIFKSVLEKDNKKKEISRKRKESTLKRKNINRA